MIPGLASILFMGAELEPAEAEKRDFRHFGKEYLKNYRKRRPEFRFINFSRRSGQFDTIRDPIGR